MHRTLKLGIITLLVPIGLALLPSPAAAQRPGYPGGDYRTASRVRLQVTPKEAQVYVDGYFVGSVKDFDGTFERVVVSPGEHEVVLYLQGYRTVRQKLQLKPREDYRIRYKMERLAAGQVNEPPPLPPPGATQGEQGAPPQPPLPRRPRAVTPPPVPPEPPQPPEPAQRPERPQPGMRPEPVAPGFGALVFRVQPAGAEILIDGERWQGPESDDQRLVVQVPAGRHRIEIRKEGYTTYSAEMNVRGGETTPLNVSLTRR